MDLGKQTPQDRPADTHRLHRIQHTDGGDPGPCMAILRREAARARMDGVVAIMAIGPQHQIVAGMFGPQQADAVDQARQRPHRIGAPRIPQQKNTITGAITFGQKLIGAPDLVVYADAGHHFG